MSKEPSTLLLEHHLKALKLPTFQRDSVNAEKGRFRSFLCACAKHEASRFRERRGTEKRGGNRVASLDLIEAEDHYQLLPALEAPTDQIFDRAWSHVIVARALDKLQSEYDRLGK